MERRRLSDPIPDRAIEPKLDQLALSLLPYAAAGSPTTCAELDRYDVAVVLQAAYNRGGDRYTEASDANAAAKRTRK